MPLKSILSRVFATKMSETSNATNARSILNNPYDHKKAISKVETAAVLRGILEDEKMEYPTQGKREDSLH